MQGTRKPEKNTLAPGGENGEIATAERDDRVYGERSARRKIRRRATNGKKKIRN